MKPLGRKLTRTRVAGHQDCGICHPGTKGGKALERRRVRREIDQALKQMLTQDQAADTKAHPRNTRR